MKQVMARLMAESLRSQLLLGLLAALALAVGLLPLVLSRPGQSPPDAVIPSEIANLDLKTLRREAALAEKRVQRLEQRKGRLPAAGLAILIDTAENRIHLLQGSRVLLEDKCSTGSGLELTDREGNRTWTFETPRGFHRVLSMVTNPVWYRPDWAFIEEGEPIPKDRASRAVADVLGDYAIAFGDGYFIHGTLYTRMLGSSVTHGCVRVDDDALKKIYRSAQPGTPIWIY